MASDASLQPCYIFFPQHHSPSHESSEITTHGLQKPFVYKPKNSSDSASHLFPCLMHGRETSTARDYRYTCFRSLFNIFETKAKMLFEWMDSEIVHIVHELMNQNMSWSDKDRIMTAIMLLNGTRFSCHYQLYSRITTFLEDCVHGPVVSLHAQRAEDMKTCFKQIIRTCLQFSGKVGLHNETQLEKNLFTRYCEYDPECIVQCIESFISAIKVNDWIDTRHIVNHCDSMHSELISHDHLECLRSLSSMRRYTEALLDAGDVQSVELLFNDDDYFRNVMDTLIHNMEKHNEKLSTSILLLNIIQKKHVSSTRKATLTWLYGELLKNDIHDLATLLDPIKTMSPQDLLECIQEVLTIENISIHFLNLEMFYKKITDLIESSTQNDPVPIMNSENNTSMFIETSTKIGLKVNINTVETEFSSVKKSLHQYLQEKLKENLISPMTLPLHELYYFNYTRTYLDVFHPRIRATIDTALSMPGHYLSCDCNDKKQAENDNHMTKSSQSQICISCQPKICIAYKLFLESGSLINISNWLVAFIQSVSCENKQNDNKQESEKYLQAEFLQSLEELRYLGFIKPTRKKTDHVAKITWMR
ncbi:hypothetical protein PCK2_000009 [Pneumocystis canis]|nr:hypothetical protein PCK2_000009 [Pneumocystis canis]